ncbi:MAG: hypothetical protein EOO03_00220 [Chitinophagaceae bacterium]|nr:MAG: hypothetical protein EOO03_00220 [Chitinophagaceae bacterium]
MRILLLPVSFVISVACFAQAKPKPVYTSNSTTNQTKTISGTRVKGLHSWSGSPFKLSADGNLIAIIHGDLTLIDVEKGTIRSTPQKLGGLSSDFRYFFSTGSSNFQETRPGKAPGWVKGIKVAGTFTDTAERIILTDYDIFDINAREGTMLATRKYSIYGWVDGLFVLDFKTGDVRDSLRKDNTMCGEHFPVAKKSYLLFPGKNSASVVLPLDSSKAAVIRPDAWLSGEFADDNYVYTHASRNKNEFTAYDRRTGKKVAALSFPGTADDQMLYALFGNRVYRYDKITATVYEEEVGNGSFTTVASYQPAGLSLPENQRWSMLAFKGPSVLFIPIDIDSAEAHGGAANTATLVALSSGKAALKISPFFVRTSTMLAQQVADKKASDEAWTKVMAESEKKKKEDAVKKAAECKKNWGNADFNKGITRRWGEFYIILESYDCEKDEYRFWLPRQPAWSLEAKFTNDYGYNIRQGVKPAQQFHSCTQCGGDGSYEVTTYSTRTKELPWGYFSGIETKSIRTTATTRKQFCNACSGQGVVLK